MGSEFEKLVELVETFAQVVNDAKDFHGRGDWKNTLDSVEYINGFRVRELQAQLDAARRELAQRVDDEAEEDSREAATMAHAEQAESRARQHGFDG